MLRVFVINVVVIQPSAVGLVQQLQLVSSSVLFWTHGACLLIEI